MLVLEENFRKHLEDFASELFVEIYTVYVVFCIDRFNDILRNSYNIT